MYVGLLQRMNCMYWKIRLSTTLLLARRAASVKEQELKRHVKLQFLRRSISWSLIRYCLRYFRSRKIIMQHTCPGSSGLRFCWFQGQCQRSRSSEGQSDNSLWLPCADIMLFVSNADFLFRRFITFTNLHRCHLCTKHGWASEWLYHV